MIRAGCSDVRRADAAVALAPLLELAELLEQDELVDVAVVVVGELPLQKKEMLDKRYNKKEQKIVPQCTTSDDARKNIGKIDQKTVSKPISISAIARVKRFFTRAKSDKDITIDIFSLHGYSSLRTMQDGPKACANKVSEYGFCTEVHKFD